MIRLITFLIAFNIIFLCFFLLTRTAHVWRLNYARRKFFHLDKAKITLGDVRQLLHKGEKDLAVYAYRELYGLDFKQAKLEVEQLERYLKK